MAGTTSKGYPYPTGTDRVSDGDNAIQALAESVDTRLGVLAHGIAALPSGGAAGAITVAVTFPAGRFTVAPTVVCTANHSQVTVSAALPSTLTGFNLIVEARNAAGANISMPAGRNAQWLAIQ